MILIVDMNWKKDSLGYYESVAPLTLVAKELDAVNVKHYSELQSQGHIELQQDYSFWHYPKRYNCITRTREISLA